MLDLEKTFIDEFTRAGVIKEGHFLLSSGLHSSQYINKDMILVDPHLRRMVVNVFADYLRNITIETGYCIFTGPAVAGSMFANLVADALKAFFVYCEKQSNGTMKFSRGFDKVLKGNDVVIIEDIITTGSSVIKTINAVKECGGIPKVVVCIWNRGTWEGEYQCEYHGSLGRVGDKDTTEQINIGSIITKKIASYFPVDCPMCDESNPSDPKTGELLDCEKASEQVAGTFTAT